MTNIIRMNKTNAHKMACTCEYCSEAITNANKWVFVNMDNWHIFATKKAASGE